MAMTPDELIDTSMMLIVHSGDARAAAFHALQEAKAGNFEEARLCRMKQELGIRSRNIYFSLETQLRDLRELVHVQSEKIFGRKRKITQLQIIRFQSILIYPRELLLHCNQLFGIFQRHILIPLPYSNPGPCCQ